VVEHAITQAVMQARLDDTQSNESSSKLKYFPRKLRDD
jgi:hypothetical protein